MGNQCDQIWQKFKSLKQFFETLFWGQILVSFPCYWAIFHCWKWPNIEMLSQSLVHTDGDYQPTSLNLKFPRLVSSKITKLNHQIFSFRNSLRPDWTILKVLGNNFICKSSPKHWWLFGLFWKVSRYVKTAATSIWATFGKIGLHFYSNIASNCSGCCGSASVADQLKA